MNGTERATKKQQELLQFVADFIKENDYGPSYREIMNGLGYKSVSTVAVHVDGLIAKGLLTRKDNSARSLELPMSGSPESPNPSSVVDEIVAAFPDLTQAKKQTLLDALEILGYSKDKARLEAKTDIG